MGYNVKNQKNRKSKEIHKTRMAVRTTASKKVYKQSSRKENKIGKILSRTLLGIVGIIIAIILVFMSGAFDISDIVVEGNNYISGEQIISFSGIELNTNIFSVSKKDVSNRIKENSYVDSVEIKKEFPNKVKLIINERKTSYCIEIASGFAYIDKQGYILELSSTRPSAPILMGTNTDLTNIQLNDRLNNDDLKKMNTAIKIMDIATAIDLSNLITRIDISDSTNYTIYLETVSKAVYLGDGYDLNTKMLYAKAIVKANEGKSGEIFLNMDLNSENPFFRENV